MHCVHALLQEADLTETLCTYMQSMHCHEATQQHISYGQIVKVVLPRKVLLKDILLSMPYCTQ